MDVSTRKLNELGQKLESLTREFDFWRRNSEADKLLQKHYSQIRRITSQLEGMQRAIRSDLDDLAKSNSANVLSETRELERDILEVHRIWEFFRSKFVLRSVDWFNPYLVAADEFAWASYSAAQEHLDSAKLPQEDLKTPPLVFFNGGTSPYTMARHFAYKAEEVAGEELRNLESSEILKELPIPLVGIPWFQVQHLPDALVIGHEVGHVVEEDFKLTVGLDDLLANAMNKALIDEKRQPAWKMWRREIFADLYGSLVGGPAFVGSLLDFLATDQTSTETDRREGPRWGAYPPDYLRILLNLAALDLQGFPNESAKLQQDLENTYATHAMKDFERDRWPIVKALLDEPYPEFKGKSLRQIVAFTPTNQTNAVTDSEHLLHGHSPATTSARVLLAAARLAYAKSPETYKEKDVHNLILKRVPEIQAEGTRYDKGVIRNLNDEGDSAAGERLFRKVKREIGRATLQA